MKKHDPGLYRRPSEPLLNPEALPKLVDLLQKEVDRIEPGLKLEARLRGHFLDFTLNNGKQAKGGGCNLVDFYLSRDPMRFIGEVSMLVCRGARAFRTERESAEIKRWREENSCDDGHEHDWRRGFYRSSCRSCGLMLMNDPPGSHPIDKGAAP